MGRNGWDEYRKLVLHEMSETSKRFDKIENLLKVLVDDVSRLKVKAAIAGGMAGLVGTALLSALISWFK